MTYCLMMLGLAGGWPDAWPYFAVAVALKLTFWALLVAAVIYGIRRFRGHCSQHLSTPLDILRARYARGELSRQDFETMRQDIER